MTSPSRGLKDAGYQAGARKVYIIEEPMAAATGADLPVHEPTTNMGARLRRRHVRVVAISLGGVVTAVASPPFHIDFRPLVSSLAPDGEAT